MSETNEIPIKPPDNFVTIIRDFTTDLSITFPEYEYLWVKWKNTETPQSDYNDLYAYCLKIYPERFFDILYQNDEIFSMEKDEQINTLFLPYVDFKIFFHCADVSENTKKTIWKYLQLILVTIMSGIQDKSVFGDTANIFDGIDETDLHSKLAETINGLSDFFKSSGLKGNLPSQEGEIPDFSKTFENMNETFKNMFEGADLSGNMDSSIPNPDDLNDHLKNLFGGKIGALAKELAEELSEDVMEMFGEDSQSEIKSTQDVLKKIMRNPKKMTELLKTVSTKIDKKMKDGEISQADIMKEAGDLMGKMKEMGGGKEFQDMMRNMTKGMAGFSGKGTRFDKGAMDRMMKTESAKERMRNKLQERSQISVNKTVLLESTTNPQNMVFKIDGDEGQQKSSARPLENNIPNDDWLDEPTVSNKTNQPKSNKSSGSSGKKKKGKK
jgi:hypothetical protein